MVKISFKRFAKQDWIHELASVVTDLKKLLRMLKLDENKNLILNTNVRTNFSLRVPVNFIKRMQIGDPNDPLLLQVLPSIQELNIPIGYIRDPLNEQTNIIPNLLRKYKNRALLLVKGACAINCRYCFRRHFPYAKNAGNKNNWQKAIDYISINKDLDEIILSGGDPLMAKDHELAELIKLIVNIPHIKRLRIHTRLPVVIPARITDNLCQMLSEINMKVILVTHINHPQEISDDLHRAMKMLKKTGIILLNQSTLLSNINDNASTLAKLSISLFDIGILPYYLHMLDKTQGNAHFFVSDHKARILMQKLLTMLSGYMIPKLVREIPGGCSKIPIDLNIKY